MTAVDPIQVAGAIIARAGRILLAQRMPPRDYAYAWESPGGKTEPGETHHQALAREVREELGIELCVEVLPDHPMATCKLLRAGLQTADVEVSLYFVGDRFEGTPVARDGQGLGWFTPSEMSRLVMAPANDRARLEIAMAVARTAR